MAAEYLLDIYSVIGLLLFFGKETFKEWTDGFWRWITGDDFYFDCHASKQGCIWGTDLYWILYFAYYVYGKIVEKNTAGNRDGDVIFGVFSDQKHK